MKMIPCEKSEIDKNFKATKVFKVLNEFVESDYECVRLEHEYTTAASGANAFKCAIKRFGFENVKVFIRNGNIYLVKD